MAWCPKCKSEYEEGVVLCSECKIELVDNLEDIVEYIYLVTIREEELDNVIEYLKYSDITDIKRDKLDNGYQLSVNSKDYKDAIKYIRTYVSERIKEEDMEEDYYFSEYKTDEINQETKVSELRSSANSFTGIGVLLLVFALLNLFGILNVVKSQVYLCVFLGCGIIFLIIGLTSYKKIPKYMEQVSKVQDTVNQMITWYQQTHNLITFYEDKKIHKEDYDEGSLFFVVIDSIKADLKKEFPDKEETQINSAAEEIFDRFLK